MLKEADDTLINEEQTGYRRIMKATSLFGGVQVLTIAISVIRSKFIAVLLGPGGMGIAGLLTATLSLISQITNFGLSTSAIKDISAAHSTGDDSKVSLIVTVFRRIMWVTGLVGAVITAVTAPWLSELAFGNSDYTFAFILLSITLVFNQISAGQSVLLRGLRQIKMMAKSAALGSTLGLVTTVPLYYFFGIGGIVPAIIIASVFSLLLTWFYASKLKIPSAEVSAKRTFKEVKGMLKLGFLISLSSMITLAASYVVRIFISNTGSVEQVGLYNAGFAIVNTYVGMIFTAMSTDFYPRLSGIAHDNKKSANAINQQAEIAILIMAPVIMVFLTFINWVVIILYSSKFTPINDMILFAVLGMMFKAASWAVAIVFLAKGAGKLFFWNELIANVYQLAFNILGYKFWGLAGIGASFLLSYFVYLIQVYITTSRTYGFRFTGEFYKLFVLQLILAVSCFMAVKFINDPWSYIAGSVFIIISGIHAYKELDKRLSIRDLLSKFGRKQK